MNESCPSDDELLAAATEDDGEGRVRLHAEGCAACRQRIEQLRQEVGALRSFSRSFSRLPAARAEATAAPADARATDRPRHDRIGRYVVVGELGSGGQADVYRVVDPELARPLVLKLARRAARDDEAHRDAAIAEGRLLATLDHPGLLHVFDAGVFEGRPYLVLEYVAGRNLEQCFDNRRPPPSDAARLIGEVARVLAYAHGRGVVHGDVTPRNIMVDADGRTRLIDFGLARLESIWQDEAGPCGGTPEFLPPELAAAGGPRKHAGPSGDVFGLGATLYWLITGRGPFAAPSVIESLERARRGEVDFGPLRAAGTPRRLVRLCEQALATDPAHRPTAADCAGRLRHWTARLAGMRRGTVAIIVLLAALVLIEAADWMSNKPTVQSVPEILVIRNDEVVNLSNVLPLRTGDRVTVTFDVSPGEPVTMVWLDAAGQVRSLPTARTTGDKLDGIRFPDATRPARVGPPEGTDMIFVCRGDPISDGDLRACLTDESPPALPDEVLLHLRRSQIEPRGPLPPRSAAASQVERAGEFMMQIDSRLRRHFVGVRGVAFPHRAADDDADEVTDE
ncbi:MAG TPA: serine/threonine-protein kinase [Pirellulales bacterium]|nr:serine/threonine-protein kinase [Pirellulales bacterium]